MCDSLCHLMVSCQAAGPGWHECLSVASVCGGQQSCSLPLAKGVQTQGGLWMGWGCMGRHWQLCPSSHVASATAD